VHTDTYDDEEDEGEVENVGQPQGEVQDDLSHPKKRPIDTSMPYLSDGAIAYCYSIPAAGKMKKATILRVPAPL
jgi:hypothetical protein